MRLHHSIIAASVVSILASVAACGGAGERSGFDTPNQTGGGNANGNGNGSSGSLGSSGADPNAQKEAETCAATNVKANRAMVDIIVVIDTSGSMDEETNQVKQNINNFANSIGNSGLDYNVIMIAAKPKQLAPIPGFPTIPGICVPQPLAGPNCADSPKFHHLDHEVASTDSLQIILDKFPNYKGWLRNDAYKVFIEVTDDNSTLAHDTFDTQLLAKDNALWGTSANRKYIFNSICGFKRNTAVLSSEKCGSAVNIGDQYQHLSMMTNGTVDSVCETSYASVFDNIAKGLVTRLGCEFAFPTADNGKQTDPSTVAIKYTPGDGSAQRPLTQVTDSSKCAAQPDGWYYDDNAKPSKIIFCPNTCTGPGADTAGKLDVAVGCKTPLPK